MSIARKLDPILEPLMGAVRGVEPLFGPSADTAEQLRQSLWYALDGTAGHEFVYDKTRSGEYVFTTPLRPDDVEARLAAAGYQRNFMSAIKEISGETAYSAWVQDPPQFDHDFPADSGPYQHDVYLFESDAGTAVYAHFENSVRAPEKHLNVAGGTGIPQEDAYVGPLADILPTA